MSTTLQNAPFGWLFSPGNARNPGNRAKPSFFRNVLRAMQESRRAAAEREIVRFLNMSGPWSDSVERELERRFASHQLRDL